MDMTIKIVDVDKRDEPVYEAYLQKGTVTGWGHTPKQALLNYKAELSALTAGEDLEYVPPNPTWVFSEIKAYREVWGGDLELYTIHKVEHVASGLCGFGENRRDARANVVFQARQKGFSLLEPSTKGEK